MNGRFAPSSIRQPARPRLAHRARGCRPLFEVLEQRTLLSGSASALSAPIVLGRTLATPSSANSAAPTPSYFAGDVENNQVTVTFTVYNEQADPETGVFLADTLIPGATLANASPLPTQNGQNLAWSLGTIAGYDRASVSITVNLPFMPGQIPSGGPLDEGATVFATLSAGAISASTPAASLRGGTLSNPALLASTVDADTNDPYIQEAAAALDYDPTQIFDYLQTQVGFNSYLGSVRGARGTLWSGAGNSLDVASLGVALMRASGIPAQYAQGTLTQSQAQPLILSMFPASAQVVGTIPAGTQTANPVSDPQLLSETESHFWFQFQSGGAMTDADPLVPGATIGHAFTTSTGTFSAVPENLEETTEIQLVAELDNTADSLFGQSGLTDTTVLDLTFDDAELVGRPLSIGNLVSQSGTSAIFTAVTNTYTPFLDMGDDAFPPSHDETTAGTPYQEVLTSFPFGSQILTGLFLNVTLSGPQGAAQTYSRALVDRIGAAARTAWHQRARQSTRPGLRSFPKTTFSRSTCCPA